MDPMSGIELIAAERRRQITVEKFTPEHDDSHVGGDLTHAAWCYMMHNEPAQRTDDASAPVDWPWHAKWWKPSDDPIRNLVKAGALIAAEIDRLQRK